MILSLLHEKGWKDHELTLVPPEFSYELMKAAHLAIAKSGTVTLELALHRVPTVVIYAVSPLDKIIAYDILRIRLPFYCLVNIIAKKELFPELIGPRLTLESLLTRSEEMLNPEKRKIAQAACDTLIQELSGKKTSQEAAAAILQQL